MASRRPAPSIRALLVPLTLPLALTLTLLAAPAPAWAQSVGAAPAAAQSLPPASAIDTLALRADARFLADDLLEGRGTGTRGAHLAALYLSSRLMALGLRGAGTDGSYLQPIPMQAALVDTLGTTLELNISGLSSEFNTPGDFLLNTGGPDAFHSFSGDVVFAGTPAHAARALAGQNLAGRVVAVVGSLGAHALRLVPDWIRRGVSGVVVLVPRPDAYAAYVRSRGRSRFFVAAPLNDPVWQPELPVLLAGPSLTQALLAGSGIDPDAVDDMAPGRSLDRSIDVTERVEIGARRAANVAGVLPGRDPRLRNQYVIYTAHYDHLGIGIPDATGDSIYNGFTDNAVGDAMLLAIARSMSAHPPRRSVLFLFATGEERGLLGSSYYAAAPLVPLDRTVADIDLNGGAPAAPPLDWRLAGGRDSGLGVEAADVAQAGGWSATLSHATPNSDYWPFLIHHVPAISLIPGSHWQGVSSAQHDALVQLWNHYQQPSDEWEPDFPFSGLQRYAQLALGIGLRVANAAHRPTFITAPSATLAAQPGR